MATSGLVQIRDAQPVSADLSAHQYKIVTFDGSGDLELAATGGTGGYVLLETADTAGLMGTILLAGKGKVIAGDTIAKGAFLTNEVTTGHAITATTGDVIMGIALEAAAVNDLFKFLAVQSDNAA